jgi:hypothetical protein
VDMPACGDIGFLNPKIQAITAIYAVLACFIFRFVRWPQLSLSTDDFSCK